MALLPKVKLKALVSFPAQVYGGTGIDVTKANGAYTLDIDYSEFGAVSTIPSNGYTLVYNTALQNYVLVPVSLFGGGGGGGGIADAPVNGFSYVRNSAAWVSGGTFSATVSAPTPPAGDNTTKLATTAWVNANPTTLEYDSLALAAAATIPGTASHIRLTGYYAVGDKGGALYKRSIAPAGAGKFQSADGAWWEISEILGFARQFGAKGDGVNNDATAINACLAKYLVCHLDEGTFRITAPITLNRDFAGLHGVSVAATKIMVDSGSIDGVTHIIGLTRLTVQDFQIDRVISGTPTGSGVKLYLRGSTTRVERVKSMNHANGFVFGATDDSLAFDCSAENNFSNGFVFTNDSSFTTIQWSLQRCTAQWNNAFGFVVAPQADGQVSVGTMINCNTYGNGQGALSAVGTPVRAIQSLRVLRCFFGGEGGDEIYLDTYGTDHHFDCCSLELAGTGPTGRNLTIAQSNVGSGIVCTTNNNTIYINACNIGGMSRHGIQSGAVLTVISNTVCGGNGQNGLPNASGILITAGTLIATGNILQAQNYGIFLSVDAANVVGGRIFGNTTGTITGNGANSTITAVRFT